MRKLSLSLTAAFALLAYQPAQAFPPVFDPVAIQNTAQVIQVAQSQLQELNQIRGMAQQTISSIGSLGNLPGQFLGDLVRDINPMQNFTGFGSDGCMLGLCGDDISNPGSASAGGLPANANFEQSREWVTQRFYAPQELNAEGRARLYAERARAARSSAQSGFAVASVARQRMTTAGQDADRVTATATSGTDLRSDIQRNTAVLMASYQERQQHLILYAALLEMEGTTQLASSNAVTSPTASTP